MADFVARNIIQTPDFGGMAQGYLQRARQEEADKNRFLDDFDKKQGLYLEGYKPAVQESWNNVQSVMDIVAEDDSPENRRKLKEAYGNYSTVAGAAQYLSDEYRKNIAAYKADPSKFDVGGDEFLEIVDDYNLRRRTRNELLEEVNNPFFIQRSSKYQLLDPYEQARKLVSDSRMKLPDFYNDKGQLNKSALRAYAERRARARVNALPENIERAMVWGAPKEGYERVESIEDLEMISGLDEDLKQSFIDRYVYELTNDFVDLVPSQLRTSKGDGSKQKKKLASRDISIQAAGGRSVKFLTLPGKVDDIIAVGVAPDGRYYVQEIRKEEQFDENKGENVTVETEEYRPATETDLTRVASKYGNTYDLSMLYGNSVSSQSDRNQDFDVNEYIKEKGI